MCLVMAMQSTLSMIRLTYETSLQTWRRQLMVIFESVSNLSVHVNTKVFGWPWARTPVTWWCIRVRLASPQKRSCNVHIIPYSSMKKVLSPICHLNSWRLLLVFHLFFYMNKHFWVEPGWIWRSVRKYALVKWLFRTHEINHCTVS